MGLYESASRWEDLVALYEGRARSPVPGAPLLARAASLAHSKLRNVARAEALYRQLLRLDPANPDALRSLCELLEEGQTGPRSRPCWMRGRNPRRRPAGRGRAG